MDTTTNAPIHDLTTLKESTMRNNAKLTKATRKQINGGGRPSKFNAAMCAEAKKLCRLGFTDAELADFFWVSEQTVNTWKRRHQEFLESLKRVKAIADAEVATSLYRRALGYSHPAVKIFADVKTGLVEQVQYTEHYSPDTVACIFCLQNRQKGKWRDKVEQEVSGRPDSGPIAVKNENVPVVLEALDVFACPRA